MSEIGDKRTLAASAVDANDPTAARLAQDFRSAKALFFPSSNRYIFPLLHGHDPQGRVTWQSTSDDESSLPRLAAQPLHGRSRRARSRPPNFQRSVSWLRARLQSRVSGLAALNGGWRHSVG